MVWSRRLSDDPEVGTKVGVRGALKDFGMLTVRDVEGRWYIFESQSGKTFRLHRSVLISIEEIMASRLVGEF